MTRAWDDREAELADAFDEGFARGAEAQRTAASPVVGIEDLDEYQILGVIEHLVATLKDRRLIGD